MSMFMSALICGLNGWGGRSARLGSSCCAAGLVRPTTGIVAMIATPASAASVMVAMERRFIRVLLGAYAATRDNPCLGFVFGCRFLLRHFRDCAWVLRRR